MHPGVLIGAFAEQENRSRAQLRNDEIGIAVTIDVGNGDGAGLGELHGVEMHVFGYVSPTAGAEIAEQAQFSAAGGFSGGNQIEPAVIVVIEGRYSPAALPGNIRELPPLETLALDVAPEADPRRPGVREGEVHPAVFVEIESNDAHCWRQIFFLEVDRG